MLSIAKLNDDYFIAKFGYSNQYFNRIRQLPGSEWDSERRMFILSMNIYELFKKEFKGEYVYSSCKYDFPNEKIEDYSAKYKLRRDYELPKLKIELYDYQRYGVNYMLNKLEEKGFVMNCDGVGLGKTASSLSTLMYLIENGIVKKALILCKKSLRYQWKNEIEKFTDYNLDNVLVVNGTPAKKKKIYEEFLSMDNGILISNYDVVVSKMDTEMLDKIKPGILIVDEIHTIKGASTKKNKEISKIAESIKYKILLTGTPMASKPEDLFGVIKIANKKYFGTKKAFEERYLIKGLANFNGRTQTVIDGRKNLDELELKLHDVMIQRTEREVELDLPEMLPPNVINVKMDKTQIAIYDFLNKEKSQISASIKSYSDALEKHKMLNNRSKITELEEKIKTCNNVLKGFQAFFQVAANDPRIFLLAGDNVKDKYGQFIKDDYKMSPKTELLIDTVQDIVNSNQKVIIFSKFERCVRLLKSDIEKCLGIKVVEYTGSINSEDRESNVKAFMTDDEVKVFIGTSAAQEGLNLQCANHVIHVDLPYILADKIQRNGRARRVGSKYSTVFTYELLTEDTVDINIFNKLKEQEDMISQVVDNNDERSNAIKKAMKSY